MQWTNLPATCTSWENLYNVVNHFPSAPAWGQADTLGGVFSGTYTCPRPSRRSNGLRHANGFVINIERLRRSNQPAVRVPARPRGERLGPTCKTGHVRGWASIIVLANRPCWANLSLLPLASTFILGKTLRILYPGGCV